MKSEEDREKVSNATTEQMREEEEEEEIDKIKKEEEDDDDDDLDPDLLLNVPDGFNEFLDAMMNEVLKESETSMTDIEESEATTRKRIRIAESEEAKASQLRVESVPALDPLEIIMEIVSKYHDFVDFILEMLKEERKYEEELEMQRWSKVLERGKHLVKTLEQRLKRLPDEMERMKNDENLQEEYSFRKTHIEDIIAQMRNLNSRIVRSPHLRVVSDLNFTENVLPSCLIELEDSKEELNELIGVIRELKEINKEEEFVDEDDEEYVDDDEEEYVDEDEEEIRVESD